MRRRNRIKKFAQWTPGTRKAAHVTEKTDEATSLVVPKVWPATHYAARRADRVPSTRVEFSLVHL